MTPRAIQCTCGHPAEGALMANRFAHTDALTNFAQPAKTKVVTSSSSTSNEKASASEKQSNVGETSNQQGGPSNSQTNRFIRIIQKLTPFRFSNGLNEEESKTLDEVLGVLRGPSPTDLLVSGPSSAPLKFLATSRSKVARRTAATVFASLVQTHPVHAIPNDIVESIVSLLDSEDTETQRASTAVVWRLSVAVENRPFIVQLGAIKGLAPLLDSKDEEVLQNAISCFANLSGEAAANEQMIQLGVLKRLMAFVDSKDMARRRIVLATLGSFTELISFRWALFSEHPALVTSLVRATNTLDRKIQQLAENVLANLVSSDGKFSFWHQRRAILTFVLDNDTDKCVPELLESGGLIPLLQHIRSDNAEIALSSATCIQNLARHASCHTALVNSGVIPPLLQCISSTADAPVKRAAAATLTSLSTFSEEIVINRAVNIVASLHSNRREVQSSVATLVSKLASYDDLVPHLLKAEIMKPVLKLSDTEDLQMQYATTAIILDLVSPTGGLHAYLNRVLEKHDQPGIQYVAIFTVIRLLQCSKPPFSEVIRGSEDILTRLRKIAEAPNPSTTSDAQGTADLAVLAQEALHRVQSGTETSGEATSLTPIADSLARKMPVTWDSPPLYSEGLLPPR
ncbi:Vacuolar protein 8 [Tulasnella sp. 403]|nr:Vacuolar protein 8 [Tulasnella sp. 403]